MFEAVLEAMRQAVQDGRLSLTRHAYEEMNDDDLFVFDLEQCIHTGTIVERQWDEIFQDWKYLIHGKSADEVHIAVAAKFDHNQHLILITTYRL